jgi:hypothetical protein
MFVRQAVWIVQHAHSLLVLLRLLPAKIFNSLDVIFREIMVPGATQNLLEVFLTGRALRADEIGTGDICVGSDPLA